MLSAESRKYFTRAFMSSGCVSAHHLRRDNHVPVLQECLRTNKTGNELVEFLKKADALDLSTCNYLPWIIVMETPSAPKAFIWQTPDEIYKSDNAPTMDAMFSIASQVFIPILSFFPVPPILYGHFFLLQEAVQFFPELLEWTEPSIKEPGIESNLSLPFDEYSKNMDPEVII